MYDEAGNFRYALIRSQDAEQEIKEYYNFLKLRYEQVRVLNGMKFNSIYSDIGSKEIWNQGVVDKISDIFQRAYAKIESYKGTDFSTYTKLYERIKAGLF